MTTGHFNKSMLTAAILSAFALPGQAQADVSNTGSAADNNVEVISVTGSRILRRGETEASPIQSFERDDLDLKGAVSIGEVLQELPSVGASLNDNGSAGTSHGSASINLRNLGENRSLVLVNGNRWVNGAGTRGFRDFVDLNTIPFAMIERVEVLQDGATAIYGADAIAGVVNIHTFKDFTGMHAKAYYGQTSHGDRETLNLDLRLGQDLGNHNLMLVASFSDQKPILTQDRDLTAIPLNGLSLGSGEGLFRSNALSSVFGFDIPAQGITREPGSDGNQLSSWRPASANDRFNRYHDNYVVGPSRRLSVYGQGVFELGQLGISEDTRLRIEAVYNRRESDQQFSAAIPVVNGSRGFIVANDPRVNPFGVELSGSDFVATNFFVDNGLRVNAQTVDTTRFGIGLEGYTTSDWHWDIFASFARNKATFVSNNQLHLDKLALGMRACDASGLSADVSDLLTGCVPVNLFNTLTPDMVNYINFTGEDSNEAKQQHLRFNITNSIADLPAGDLLLAAGMEYRKESGTDVPDSIINSAPRVNSFNTTSSAPRTGTIGSYDLYEAYAELSIPLLSGHAMAHHLEVNLASRFSDYSTFGSTVNSKAGILYRPVADLMLRATWAEGFRAPSILELYEGERESFAPVNDPCADNAGLPGCTGVPAGYTQNEANVPITVGGNILLEPETSENISLGLVYTPSQLDGFSLTLDWYNIQIDNTISTFGTQNLLDLCATTNRNCGVIQRATSGEIINIVDGPVNLNKTEVSGMDAVVRYRLNTDQGRWDLAANLSRLNKFVESSTLPDGTFIEVDKKGTAASREAFPTWRGFLSAQWRQEAWSSGYSLRYIGDTTETFAGEPLSIGSMVYHSVFAGYNFDNGAGIKLGINNLTDKQPPTSRTNLNINFDQQTYNAVGRFIYLQLSYDF
ncbi:TonB-dependent receptor [Alkalimonas amylolytica]|uniref:TonB-dependent Receptor Plug Domain n=1 Tax=Alkalimonas amylolytica TaxID=152573 RepID=A0A1H4CKK5_ALKAM|nr:TonB-dependent receptor [Alkalimonas amylolytica]SEA60592.1 TonB-dependent Receptor Plug Domain [Alkalimonas amylolytica]